MIDLFKVESNMTSSSFLALFITLRWKPKYILLFYDIAKTNRSACRPTSGQFNSEYFIFQVLIVLCGHCWLHSTQKHNVCHIVVLLRGGTSGSNRLKIHIKHPMSQSLLSDQRTCVVKTVKEVYTYNCDSVYLVCICKSGGIMHCSKKRTRQYP